MVLYKCTDRWDGIVSLSLPIFLGLKSELHQLFNFGMYGDPQYMPTFGWGAQPGGQVFF